MKKHFVWGYLLNLLLLALVACAKDAVQIAPKYVYKNPSSGNEVALRPSNYAVEDQFEKKNIKFENPVVRVSIDSKTVWFQVQKNDGGTAESIEMSGTLDDNLTGWLDDTQKVRLAKSRMKGFAQCLGSDVNQCPQVSINVYFELDGKIETHQFVALQDSSATQITPGKDDPSKQQNPPQNSSDGSNNVSNDDEIQSETESEEPHQNVEFVAPKPDDNFLHDLNPNSPTPPSRIDSSNTSAYLLNINLTDGGIAKGLPWSGYIAQKGIVGPADGEGIHMSGPPEKNYGTGFLIDFVMRSARELSKQNPNCGVLPRFYTSKRGGGLMVGHKSHQNGLDMDLGYFQTKECNFAFFKMVIAARIDGKPLVDRIFVGPKIKPGYCSKFNKDQDQETLRHMQVLAGHDNHFHLRVFCSPEFVGCGNNRDELPAGNGCDGK